jgi:hypothetical protein
VIANAASVNLEHDRLKLILHRGLSSKSSPSMEVHRSRIAFN